MSTEVDNYLESMGLEVRNERKHYGVKGMQWGVTRDQAAADLVVVGAVKVNQTQR